MGLLPDIARDLLPAQYAASPEDALAQTGAMIAAYAAGVVVGAPTIAALAARFPRRAAAGRARHRVHGRHRRLGARADVRARRRRALRRRAAARRLLRRRRPGRREPDGSRQPRARGRVRALGSDDRQRHRRAAHHAARPERGVARRLPRGRGDLRGDPGRHPGLRAGAARRPGRDVPARAQGVPPHRRLVRAADRRDRLRRVLRRLHLRRPAGDRGDRTPRRVRAVRPRGRGRRHDDRQPDRRAPRRQRRRRARSSSASGRSRRLAADPGPHRVAPGRAVRGRAAGRRRRRRRSAPSSRPG